MSMPWWLMLTAGFLLGAVIWTPLGWGACKVTLHWRRIRRAAHDVRGMAVAGFWAVVALIVVALVGLTHFGAFG
jgi:hypothetical protein